MLKEILPTFTSRPTGRLAFGHSNGQKGVASALKHTVTQSSLNFFYSSIFLVMHAHTHARTTAGQVWTLNAYARHDQMKFPGCNSGTFVDCVKLDFGSKFLIRFAYINYTNILTCILGYKQETAELDS